MSVSKVVLDLTIDNAATPLSDKQRAVANTNKSPTPNKFRQFSSPRVFDVLRYRRRNEMLLRELSKFLSGRFMSTTSATAASCAFVTDFLPSMRIIVPNVVNPSFENFYSVAREESLERQAKREGITREVALNKSQEEVLREDDIAEFDSDA